MLKLCFLWLTFLSSPPKSFAFLQFIPRFSVSYLTFLRWRWFAEKTSDRTSHWNENLTFIILILILGLSLRVVLGLENRTHFSYLYFPRLPVFKDFDRMESDFDRMESYLLLFKIARRSKQFGSSYNRTPLKL